MPTSNVRMRVGLVALGVMVLAGCSSGHPTAKRVSPSTTAPTRAATKVVPVVKSEPSPARVALTIARRLVNEAVLPGGAGRSEAPVPDLLRGPFEAPAGDNIVLAQQAWIVPEPASEVVGFLKLHVPTGFNENGVGSMSSRTAHTMELVEYSNRPLPANITAAELDVRVEASGAASSIVNVVGVAQWTPPRPARERIGAADDVVIVSVVHFFQPGKPVVRRVVVTDRARVAAIVRAFNDLRVAPVGEVFHCYLLRNTAVSYRIAFATSARATPDVVATIAPCANVAITVDGRSRASLSDNDQMFSRAVAHALDMSALQFQ
jgi:hypothetical protein